ncbi:hypothetical protein BDP27DRAFT_1362201 [Rhodocollybia butyracea]|uniref:Uncharacterized protein n=1 Tax=Rhodocollybia butyracea TaxID=206335 RepID=A0A9P5U9H7_9AGAR|nr:hypothetical protein BDP27DRAFT_1362201 [Rhodocollybia butyracea]
MPIYQTVTDVGFYPQNQTETVLKRGSWVVPTKGRYEGDVGLVVDDDYDAVDTSVSALVMFIPRIKFPNSPSSKRPPKAALSVDFRKSPNQWQNFDYISQLQAWCISDDCADPFQCEHQPFLQKRYQIFGQVIRGGFALVISNVFELRLINRMPAGVHALFTELPLPDDLRRDLHIRLPPPDSWTFSEGDEVSFTRRFGINGSFLVRCDLGDLPVGVVGTILKVHEYVCDVDLHRMGHRSIPFFNLVKAIGVGRSVKINDSVGSVQEVRRVELGQSTLASVSASRVILAGRDGIVTHRYGDSLDIWIQDLELVITLDPNSVVDHTDTTAYSRDFTPSAPRRVFDEFSVVERQKVRQRPSMAYHKWDSVAHYDLRNATSLKESAWLLQNNSRPSCLHPSQYYALGRVRPPGRLPWFGVRVTVDLGASMASGEVRDVIPKEDNDSDFQVLVASYDVEGNLTSSWFDYGIVRREDNRGHLHEFSTYTGRVPWQGLRVRVIHGPLRDSGIGVVKDVSVDSQLTSISGLLLDIEFEGGYVYGERRRARVDYDHVRQLNNRFIHDGWSSSMAKNAYFQFKLGYTPKYSEHAQELLSRPASVSSQAIALQQSSPPPPSPVSAYLRFADPRWKNAFQQDFWLLDRRITQTLESREIYIWSPVDVIDIRVSFHETSSGLELRYVKDHKGGRKTPEVVDPRCLSATPMSMKLKGSATANGLYLICLGEHTGKVTRRVNYLPAYPPNPDNDIWVLQVVQCVWARGRMLTHEESIVAHEPLLRLGKQTLALVHEVERERAHGNALMATLRLQHGGSAPHYTLVDGQAQKI